MVEAPIKFAILGCAQIAAKLSRAINLAPNATIHAVASRSADKGAAFAAANGIPPSVKIYGSYEAALDDSDVDAVYLPLPTSLHRLWAVKAAEKKKHVLLEKPVALNAAEFEEIVEACESNGVQFMDGTMWMHHPRTEKMKEVIADEERFGQLKVVQANFAYRGGPDFLTTNIRVKPDLDSLGALGDVGWYCIRAILWAVDYKLPKTVIASRNPIFNEAGVILSCGSSMYWEDGKEATFYCSFLTSFTMDLTLLGTNANLRLHDFTVPFQESTASYHVISQFSETPLVEEIVENDLPQEALMVKEFASLVGGIKGSGLKPETKWVEISRKTQKVMDAVKASIESGFEAVEVID